MPKVLMKGNEAIAEAAIRVGCRFFFGYPITPQNEIPEYMSRELPRHNGTFIQSESEVSAINMIYGAAGAGARCMTSSSSPGISLKQEGISYIAGAELPCVIVNIMRAGPGLGGILPSQSDYFQATRGGGHGNYRNIVLAPNSVQESVDLVIEAFDLGDKYRMPVMILGDGILGQMMEAVEFRDDYPVSCEPKQWAATGTKGKRAPNVINSLNINPVELEAHNNKLNARYCEIAETEARYEAEGIEDAEIVVVAYGTTSRIAQEAIEMCKSEGIAVELIRPVTLWPFPDKAFDKISEKCVGVLCVEMSTGQMLDDVKIAVNGRFPVSFYGRSGGMIPEAEDIANKIRKLKEASA